MTAADLGFWGEIADLYHRYRHGYPDAVLDAVAGMFGLTADDLVVDVGCGTGQLTLPMAPRVGAVIGVDPQPDMLQRARLAARDAGVANAVWMLGADADLPAVGALLAGRSVGAVTVGQALHWMDHQALFSDAMPLLRPGGGIAVVTNGTPLWLQDTDWSRGRLIAQEANLNSGFWAFMQNFNINKAGFVIVGMFIVTWAVALSIWRFGKIEQKWDLAAAKAAASPNSSE
jgi:SAM-dependent methyltransferase